MKIRGKVFFSLLIISSAFMLSSLLAAQAEVSKPAVAPSRTERIFTNDKIIGLGEDLKQFGYDIFVGAEFAPAETASVGKEYILGPGDELIIDIWGKLNERYELKIDREGKITIPRVGVLYIWGKSFEDTSEYISKSINREYTNIDINISLGRLRTIKIFVLGEVKKPGAYLVSAVSTFLHGLYHSGGYVKSGSLRNIQLIRQNKVIKTLDVCDLLLKGDRSDDINLLADDMIYVPTIGRVVGIYGNVKKPAIYELKPEEKLSDVIEMAQGIIDVEFLQKVRIERLGKDERYVLAIKEFEDKDKFNNWAKEQELKNGDVICIFPTIYDVFPQTTVSITGMVNKPGVYRYKEGMRLSDLIFNGMGVTQKAYLDKADLFRFRKDETRESVAVDLNKVLKGDKASNIVLKPHDELVVHSIYDFMPTTYVHITGEVYKPGKFELVKDMKISDLIFATAGVTEVAYLKRAELFRKNIKKGGPAEIIEVDLTDIVAGKKDSPQNLTLEQEDHLFTYPNPDLAKKPTVTIKGEVCFSGTYVIQKGERFSSFIKRAGGFNDTAFIKGVIFIREEIKDVQKKAIDELIDSQRQALLQEEASLVDSIMPEDKKELRLISLERRKKALDLIAAKKPGGRIIVDLEKFAKIKGTEKDILLQDGDQITVPEVPDWVAVVGAVYNPCSVSFKSGQKYSYYLEKVGSLTKYADKESVYVILPDGRTQSSNTGFGVVGKGSIIVVPTR